MTEAHEWSVGMAGLYLYKTNRSQARWYVEALLNAGIDASLFRVYHAGLPVRPAVLKTSDRIAVTLVGPDYKPLYIKER